MVEDNLPARFRLLQLQQPLGGGKEIVIDARHPAGEGKIFRALANQQHVRALLEYQTRRQHRITQMFDPGYRPRLQAIAVHHAGVQFVGLIAGKYRAHPGVKQRALFQQPNGLGYGIQRTGARSQHLLPAFDDSRQRRHILSLPLRRHLRARNRPCAAVNCYNRLAHFASP